jgi:outer membrane biosynthesis protein TonB
MSAAVLNPRPAGPTWSRAATVLLLALVGHAFVLHWAQRALTAGTAWPEEAATIDARLLPPPAPPAAAPPVPAAPVPAPRPRRPRPPPSAVAPTEPLPAASPIVETVVVADEVAAAEPPPIAEAPAAAEEAAAAEPNSLESAQAPPPVETAPPEPFALAGEPLRLALAALAEPRAALPAAARWVYRTTNSEIRLASGTTYVDWSLGADGRYDLRLSTAALGMTVIELHSQGSLREFGLAPDRYTETRARRGPESANFDWDGRRVTFSARPHERGLAEGMQDRISFQVQLMLVGQARPDLFRKGNLVELSMAGRDDLAAYRFRSAGPESTATGIGAVEAVRLERVTASDAEARIEVWLAPKLNWLPVRLRFTDRLGRVTETVLEALPAS